MHYGIAAGRHTANLLCTSEYAGYSSMKVKTTHKQIEPKSLPNFGAHSHPVNLC